MGGVTVDVTKTNDSPTTTNAWKRGVKREEKKRKEGKNIDCKHKKKIRSAEKTMWQKPSDSLNSTKAGKNEEKKYKRRNEKRGKNIGCNTNQKQKN